jgi:hypothetical protein
MKLALLPCAAIAVMCSGCGDDDGASPIASVRVGVPPVEAAITVPTSSTGMTVAATEYPSAESTVVSAVEETSDTTTATPYYDVDVVPGLGTDEFVGARDDVQLDRCELDGDHWVAAGTVTNSSGAGAAYRIYVAFNPPGSPDARGMVQADFLIPDGESQPWEVVAWITDPGLECVLRVERITG